MQIGGHIFLPSFLYLVETKYLGNFANNNFIVNTEVYIFLIGCFAFFKQNSDFL